MKALYSLHVITEGTSFLNLISTFACLQSVPSQMLTWTGRNWVQDKRCMTDQEWTANRLQQSSSPSWNSSVMNPWVDAGVVQLSVIFKISHYECAWALYPDFPHTFRSFFLIEFMYFVHGRVFLWNPNWRNCSLHSKEMNSLLWSWTPSLR